MVSILIVERNWGYFGLIMLNIQDVEEMNPLLLYIIIHPEHVIDPLRAGGMPDNRIVVAHGDTLPNYTKISPQISLFSLHIGCVDICRL